MEQDAGSPFEVLCHDCHVTFALGTKQCLHCGGRLAPRGDTRPIARPDLAELLEPIGAPETVIVEEETRGRWRLPISPVTLLWLVLIAGSVAQRACQSD
jgi:hypothetical protein